MLGASNGCQGELAGIWAGPAPFAWPASHRRQGAGACMGPGATLWGPRPRCKGRARSPAGGSFLMRHGLDFFLRISRSVSMGEPLTDTRSRPSAAGVSVRGLTGPCGSRRTRRRTHSGCHAPALPGMLQWVRVGGGGRARCWQEASKLKVSVKCRCPSMQSQT